MASNFANATTETCVCLCKTPGGWSKLVQRDEPEPSGCSSLNGPNKCGQADKNGVQPGTLSNCVVGELGHTDQGTGISTRQVN